MTNLPGCTPEGLLMGIILERILRVITRPIPVRFVRSVHKEGSLWDR